MSMCSGTGCIHLQNYQQDYKLRLQVIQLIVRTFYIPLASLSNHYMKGPLSRPVPLPVAGFMVKVLCVPTKLYTTSELTPGPSGSTAVTYRAQNTTPITTEN